MKVSIGVLAITVLISGCRLRTATAADTASAASAEPFLGLGVCDITGELPKTMAFDRFEITLPYAGPDLVSTAVAQNTARIEFVGAADLKITEGLDLYDRAGRIAQVSGAIVGDAPNYDVKFSVKVSLSSASSAQTGFAVIDGMYGSATVPVSCDWTERTDLNVAEVDAGGVDTATLNPNSGGGLQLVADSASPLLCR